MDPVLLVHTGRKTAVTLRQGSKEKHEEWMNHSSVRKRNLLARIEMQIVDVQIKPV